MCLSIRNLSIFTDFSQKNAFVVKLLKTGFNSAMQMLSGVSIVGSKLCFDSWYTKRRRRKNTNPFFYRKKTYQLFNLFMGKSIEGLICTEWSVNSVNNQKTSLLCTGFFGRDIMGTQSEHKWHEELQEVLYVRKNRYKMFF